MKETYFTIDTIEEESNKMLSDISARVRTHDYKLDIDRSALIVLDMQKYFLDKASHAFIPATLAIVPVIKKLSGGFISKQRPVIFTRHLNNAENAGQMSVWWNDLIERENRLSEIVDELAYPDAAVIEKSQYDAFYNTDLENILSEHNVNQVVVSGIMTHLCCETTSRSAFVRGFEVFFPVDATASYNRKFHEATLLNLAHGFAHPVLSKEILSAIKGDNAN